MTRNLHPEHFEAELASYINKIVMVKVPISKTVELHFVGKLIVMTDSEGETVFTLLNLRVNPVEGYGVRFSAKDVDLSMEPINKGACERLFLLFPQYSA
jgi:hypothetical protein